MIVRFITGLTSVSSVAMHNSSNPTKFIMKGKLHTSKNLSVEVQLAYRRYFLYDSPYYTVMILSYNRMWIQYRAYTEFIVEIALDFFPSSQQIVKCSYIVYNKIVVPTVRLKYS